MTGFRVVSRTTQWAGGFLELEALEVEGPDGESFERFVVRHPGAVVVVPIDPDATHALCVRQYRAAIGRHLLEVPAGKRDVAHEAPHEAAARELEEEIGMRAGRLVKLGEFYNSPGFCDEYSHVFAALDLVPLHTAHPVREEEAEMTVERVRLADVHDLIARGELVDAKSIVGLLLARELLRGSPPPDATGRDETSRDEAGRGGTG